MWQVRISAVMVSGSPSSRSHQLFQPEALFGHIFGEDTGFLVTFTAHQARFRRPDARHNELADTRQRSWSYPVEVERAAKYLLATNAAATVRSLWLDEDEGAYPEIGPQPTAVVASSAKRRHLYWRLTQDVAVEWAVTMNRR